MCTAARGALAALALLALTATACTPVTQLLVVVRSDLPPEDVAEVHIAVVPGEPFSSPPTTRQAVIGNGEGRTTLPFSFGVLPRRGDPSSRVEITVSAIGTRGATTVTRLVRTGFSEGRTLHEFPGNMGEIRGPTPPRGACRCADTRRMFRGAPK
jgi:hypothetical protein